MKKMRSRNMIYIVTDLTAHGSGHIAMTSPEQFINWIETEIIQYNEFDGQIMDAANRLIEVLNLQIAGGSMYEHINRAAKELDLRVTIITGKIIADWNE